MKLTTLAVLAASAVALAAPTFAQPAPQTPEQQAATFDAADANKDGKLDLAEFKNTLPEQFRGQVSDEQLAGFMGRRDTDGDKFLSKAEFTAPRAPRPAQ